MEDNIKPGWRTSSYTGNGGGNCVEAADQSADVLVRDTKDRSGPVLRFSTDAWQTFTRQLKRSLTTGPTGSADARRGHSRFTTSAPCGISGVSELVRCFDLEPTRWGD